MTRFLTISVCAAAAIAELYVLAFYAPERVDSRARHLALVDEFATGAHIRQTFVCAAGGLDRVELLVHASRSTDVVLAWELAALQPTGETQLAAAGRRRLAVKKGDSWQPFALSTADPLPAGRYAFTATLDKASTAAAADAGVAVMNALDNPLRGGYLTVNGVPRWGDLVLRVPAAGDTVAGRFTLRVVPGLPWPFNRGSTWVGLLLLANALAAVTTWEMLLE